MKQLKLFLFVVLVFVNPYMYGQSDSPNQSNGLVWYTDLMKANEISTSTKKPIFAFFTGSDWCGWCIKLQKDVIAKPEFVKWAKENVVLLELDFPRGKPLSTELFQQNNQLQQTFGVQGYPTIWLFNMIKDDKENKLNIVPLGSLGYPRGAEIGKEEVTFLKEANSILEKGNKK